MKSRLGILVLLLLAGVIPAGAQQSDGLYAVWSCPLGSITTQLFYVEAPMTVANFVGLAEGSRDWIEESSGRSSRARYFDGIAVNRVADIPERIIQTGSQNGTNSGGGPGYTFPDEFHADLSHDRAGVLSMANSGLNSNGSQVFFTLGALPGLDGVHSVFGQVTGGLDVLTAMGELPRINGKPDPEVVFDRVEIVRMGPGAQAFDVSAHGLPTVVGIHSIVAAEGAGLAHRVEYPRPSQLRLATSLDLGAWSPAFSQWRLDNAAPTRFLINLGGDTGFFTALRVEYPEPIYTPYQPAGGRLTATDGSLDIQLGATSAEGTVYAEDGMLTGDITFWRWTPTAYRGTLFVVHTDALMPTMNIHFAFHGPNHGIYKGDVLWFNGSRAFSVAGDFGYAPAP